MIIIKTTTTTTAAAAAAAATTTATTTATPPPPPATATATTTTTVAAAAAAAAATTATTTATPPPPPAAAAATTTTTAAAATAAAAAAAATTTTTTMCASRRLLVHIIIMIIIIVVNRIQLWQHQGPGKTRVIRRVLISITFWHHPHPLSQPQLYRHTAAARGRIGTIESGVGSAVHHNVGYNTAVFLSTPQSGGEDVGSRYSRREHARCAVIATAFVHLYVVEDNWFAELCLCFVDASGTKHHRPARLFWNRHNVDLVTCSRLF